MLRSSFEFVIADFSSIVCSALIVVSGLVWIVREDIPEQIVFIG